MRVLDYARADASGGGDPRRSIHDIMYTEQELDVALLQPPLFKPIFPEDQDPVFNHYLGVITGRAALMNDLGTEPNHGLLQLAAILRRAGARTDVFDFHVLDIVLRQQRRIISEDDFRAVIAALFGYKFNSRRAAAVVDQIEATRDTFGAEFVCMGDLTFMAHKPTGLAICRELIQRETFVRWSTQTTIGRIDPESARLMADSGCVQVGFGVESGSQLIIQANNKNACRSGRWSRSSAAASICGRVMAASEPSAGGARAARPGLG